MTVDSRTRWLALYVLCLGDLMIVLDVTIVGVALPSIREDLGFSETSLAWVVNAYLLTFGGFLLLGGRLGDLFGHRRLFLVGIDALHAGLARLRPRDLAGAPDRGAGGAGPRRRGRLGGRALADDDALHGAGGPGEGDGHLRLRRLRRRQSRRAPRRASSRTRSTGTGSSSSTSLSAPSSSRSRSSWCPASRGLAAERRLDVAGAVTVTAALMLAVYAIVNGNQEGWTSAPDARAARRRGGAAGDLRRDRGRGSPRRWCRSASSGCATSWSRTSSASSGPRPCSPGSSSRRSTSSSCSATARCRSASPSCRRT